MNMSFAKRVARVTCLLPVLLAACAGKPLQPEALFYRCEAGLDFTVRFVDDTVVLNGSRGYDVLYRNAGGIGPKQIVYTNPRMRAEFSQGPTGHEAILHYSLVPLVVRCVRDKG